MNETVTKLLMLALIIVEFYLPTNFSFSPSLIYGLLQLIFIIPFWSLPLLVLIIVLTIIHFSINAFWSYDGDRKKFVVFVCLLACIYTGDIYLILNGFSLNPLGWFAQLQQLLQFDVDQLVSWAVLLLLIHRPASQLVKHSLYRFRPHEETIEQGHPNAGALIGSLERIIILLFLSQGQFAAIGFILTAKSIARYNKIIEDPYFSEYFLLGTLFSTIIVVGSFYLFF